MRNIRRPSQNSKSMVMMIKNHMSILILTQKITVMTSKKNKLQKKIINLNFLKVLVQKQLKPKKMGRTTTTMMRSTLCHHRILTTTLKPNQQIISQKKENQMPKNFRTLMSLTNEK